MNGIDFDLVALEKIDLRVVSALGEQIPLSVIHEEFGEVMDRIDQEEKIPDEFLFCNLFASDKPRLDSTSLFVGVLLAGFMQLRKLSVKVLRTSLSLNDLAELELQMDQTLKERRIQLEQELDQMKFAFSKEILHLKARLGDTGENSDLHRNCTTGRPGCSDSGTKDEDSGV